MRTVARIIAALLLVFFLVPAAFYWGEGQPVEALGQIGAAAGVLFIWLYWESGRA